MRRSLLLGLYQPCSPSIVGRERRWQSEFEARKRMAIDVKNLERSLGDVAPRVGSRSQGLSPDGPRVSVVVPTLNEALNLPHVLPRLPSGLHEVVLVDGFSTDDSVDVARSLLPEIRVVHQTRRGKGNALACGFAAVRGDVIVMLDADGSADPAEIPEFVAALSSGADFAKGSRFIDGGGSDDITPLRRIGNWGLTSLVNTLYGTEYSDLCYGYNAFWTRCLPAIDVDCDGFEVETLHQHSDCPGGFASRRGAKLRRQSTPRRKQSEHAPRRMEGPAHHPQGALPAGSGRAGAHRPRRGRLPTSS